MAISRKKIPIHIQQAVTILERPEDGGPEALVLKPAVIQCILASLPGFEHEPERFDEMDDIFRTGGDVFFSISFEEGEPGILYSNDAALSDRAMTILKQCSANTNIGPELGKKVAAREVRRTLPVTSKLPVEISRKIGQYAATPKITGGRKKTNRRKPRKTRRRNRS